MGMLFGGWFKEDEETVNSEFGGDWNKFKEWQESQRSFKWNTPIKTDYTIDSILPTDIIGYFNPITKQVEDEFLIEEIKDKQIIGRYIDCRDINNAAKSIYNRTDWSKICSTIKM